MTIEVTTRLTLKSCVSQLTELYNTTLRDIIIEQGREIMAIHLCDEQGERLPYYIFLHPSTDYNKGESTFELRVSVYFITNEESYPQGKQIFVARINKEAMSTKAIYQCALHIAGDFIKFNEKGI